MDCGYFEWFDNEMTSFQKNQFLALKSERDRLQEQLRSKIELEGVLNEKLAMSRNRIEEMSLLTSTLEKEIEELKVEKGQMVVKLRNLKREVNTLKHASKVLAFVVACLIFLLLLCNLQLSGGLVSTHLMLS